MQFLFPGVLWALALLAIPVIIHLFYFRRFKKVYFSNVRFLKEIKEETSSRNRLKNLLILLSRLLALACLIFAFAQPFLGMDNAERNGRRATSVFVDNSFSMEAKTEDVILLEKAKTRAREIVNSHKDDDLLQILTHDFEGQHQRLVNKTEALGLIENIEITPAVRKLSNIYKRQRQCLDQEEKAVPGVYILSDFQKSIVDLNEFSDSTCSHYLMPFQSVEETNVSIDSAWFESPVVRPNEINKMIIRLKNRGDNDAENIRLSIQHDDQEKPISVTDISAGKTHYDTFNLSISNSGWQEAHLSISDHPITFDDSYYLAFNVREKVDVLVINDRKSNRYLSSSLKGLTNATVDYTSKDNIDYSKFKDFELIILEDLSGITSGLSAELDKYIESGGNVVIFPSLAANINAYNAFFNKVGANILKGIEDQELEVGRINTDEFVFSNVFSRMTRNIRLPKTNKHYSFSKYQGRGEEILLAYRNGSSFISKYTKGGGRLYVCASTLAPNNNSLVKEAEIFVPMIYKMAISRNQFEKAAHIIGKDDYVVLSDGKLTKDEVVEIQGSTNFIPGIRQTQRKTFLTIENQIDQSGIYSVVRKDEEIQKLAFNYDRTESDLDYMTLEEIQKGFLGNVEIIDNTLKADLTTYLSEKERGKSLWKTFLILCLIFLAIEQVLIKIWKT